MAKGTVQYHTAQIAQCGTGRYFSQMHEYPLPQSNALTNFNLLCLRRLASTLVIHPAATKPISKITFVNRISRLRKFSTQRVQK